MKYHYISQVLVESQHKITVDIVGLGGTGSHVLTNIAMMSYAMKNIGKQPLFVRTFDPDIIHEHNIGRQAFSSSDVGKNKAVVLTERINRHYGTDWSAFPIKYHERDKRAETSNIVITCVDSLKARRDTISSILPPGNSNWNIPYGTPCYWLDIGNSARTGQIFLGTFHKVSKPDKESVQYLPMILDEYKDIKDDPNEPSCSMIEALNNQDLFINKIMATYAVNMLWELFSRYRISYRGIFINLETLKTSPVML